MPYSNQQLSLNHVNLFCIDTCQLYLAYRKSQNMTGIVFLENRNFLLLLLLHLRTAARGGLLHMINNCWLYNLEKMIKSAISDNL